MLSRTITVALLCFSTLINIFGSQAFLPQLTAFFDTDPAAMGLAVNASTFGMAVAGLVVALFSRRINRVKGIWLSLALLSVPTTLSGFVDDLDSVHMTTRRLRPADGHSLYAHQELSGRSSRHNGRLYHGNVFSNLAGRLMAANFADWFGLSISFWLFALLNLAGALLAYSP
jgi:predicted MFS family arabinose efflux permease